MGYKIEKSELRIYRMENSCIFKKNNEAYGGLSNMATLFPLNIHGIEIRTAEALYQACRFPHLPEVQKKIVEEKSPMTVKMISNAHKKKSREDWDQVKMKIMRWCIQVKLAQNFVTFGSLLEETGMKDIVENSAKDNYWGAIPNEDGTIFTGMNVLGRLLMQLRQIFLSQEKYSLLYVHPLQISDFMFFGSPIGIIDERFKFINWLEEYWKYSQKSFDQLISKSKERTETVSAKEYRIFESKMNVEESVEPEINKEKKIKSKGEKKKASKKAKRSNQAENQMDLISKFFNKEE